MSTTELTSRVQVLGAPGDRFDEILTPAALDFLGRLAGTFADRYRDVLTERRRRALRLSSGSPLDFSLATSCLLYTWWRSPGRRSGG